VLYDLGQGERSIVVLTVDGRLHAIDPRGEERPGFPLQLPEPAGAIAAGDVDGDGLPDLALASHRQLFLVHGDGALHPGGAMHAGFPRALAEAPFSTIYARAFAPPVAPPTGPILVASSKLGRAGSLAMLLTPLGRPSTALLSDGSAAAPASASDPSAFGSASPVSSGARAGGPIFAAGREACLADLDGDGAVDLAAAAGSIPLLLGPPPSPALGTLIAAWDGPSGRFRDAFPEPFEAIGGGILARDTSGDHQLELVFGNGERLFAITPDGRSAAGWPKAIGGALAGTPAAGDLDGDLGLDVVAATRAGLLFAWRTAGSATGHGPWDGDRHDLAATGNVETPTAMHGTETPPGRCGCSAAVPRGGASALLLLAGLLVLRPRLRRASRFALLWLGLTACATPTPGIRSFDDLSYGLPNQRAIHSARARVDLWIADLPGPEGSAMPIVLLHPWGTNMAMWGEIGPAIARSGRRVLLLDLPGHGRSGKPFGRYPVRRLAAAVLDALDAAGIRRAFVAGNSLGGATAIELARIRPDRVAGVVLIGAPGGRPIPEWIASTAEHVLRSRHLATISEPAFLAAWDYVDPDSSAIGQRMRQDAVALRATPEWEVWAEATSSALREVVRFAPPLESIATPALVVQGGSDRIVWPSSGEALARRLPHATLLELEGCGHFVELDCPEPLLRAMQAFVLGIERATPPR
jgi:pimeloyl-ACP methyl ester carboxylesterase